MTADVHRHGQSGHMGGGGLNGQAQTGGLSAKALGPHAQGVDRAEQVPLQVRVKGVGIGLVDGAEQGVLGQIGYLVKVENN